MKAQFIGTCVDNPFRTFEMLIVVIGVAVEIKKATFLRACAVDHLKRADFKRFPNDYSFFKSGNVYFYEWSAIEHFYKGDYKPKKRKVKL